MSYPTFHEDWYSNEQCMMLVQLYNTVKEETGLIIEIGCWEGKSTIHLANTCYPEVLICNDTWLGNLAEEQIGGEPHITTHILKHRDVYQVFINNMNQFTKSNYKVVKEDCLEWLKTVNEPIKFCHIDASHDYHSVKKTIDLVRPHMVKKGIICGDDYFCDFAQLDGGVQRAVNEAFTDFKVVGNKLWYWINE